MSIVHQLVLAGTLIKRNCIEYNSGSVILCLVRLRCVICRAAWKWNKLLTT